MPFGYVACRYSRLDCQSSLLSRWEIMSTLTFWEAYISAQRYTAPSTNFRPEVHIRTIHSWLTAKTPKLVSKDLGKGDELFTLERLLTHHDRDCKVDLLLTRSCAFDVSSSRSHGRLNGLKSFPDG